MDGYRKLSNELDKWTDVGITAAVWWRDDDAVTQTDQLRTLLAIAQSMAIGVGLGIVPALADESLRDLIVGGDHCVWQHGWRHHFHAAGEFGEGRPIEQLVQDALSGQQALDDLFGTGGWQRVFVPPNHALSVPFKSLLPGLGYLGVSSGVPLTPRLVHVLEANAEVDVMNWPEGRVLPESTICEMLIEQFAARRSGEVPVARPLGVLTHHRVFNDAAWDVTRRLFAGLRAHPAVTLRSARTLFEFTASNETDTDSSSTNLHPRRAAAVTVVLTSCGRPDLLTRTLDSFFSHNTYRIHAFIVMEDGERVSPLSDDERYRRYGITWLSTGRRIGQMRAIDAAYSLVETDYIFHCEDDWEFHAPGFIEESLAVLERCPWVLQVWLRALNDTNGHPVDHQVFRSGGVAYRLMRPGFDSSEWGTWHGFSFNPGLRRRKDMALVGSFAALAPSAVTPSWEVERIASEFYLQRGFLAAAVTSNDGKGYVSHIGWGRRIGNPGDM